MRLKIVHAWYDGPQVGVYVETKGKWVPFGHVAGTGALIDAMERIDPDWDPDTWPVGTYTFDGTTITPEQ